MEHSSLPALLSILEEIEEPCPKKLKIDRSHLSSKKEKGQLLERLYYVDKSSNKPFSFPKVLHNFSQNSLEFQEKNCTSFKTNVKVCSHFKLCMNANLQSKLLENIPFIEKLRFENKYCSITKDANSSELNANDKTELPKGSIYFYDTLAEKLLGRMECLFTDVPEFQNNENEKGFHDVCEILRSEHIPKPVTDSQYINRQTLHLCLPTSSFMEGRLIDFESLFYEYKNVAQDSNTLSCKKQRRCPANNNLRRNKVFKHMYMPYSRNCGVIIPKLVKCAGFELFVADKRIHNWSTAIENNDTSISSQIILLNTQQKQVFHEKRTKECFMVSRDTIEDCTFSVVGKQKEQMARLLLSNNQILPDNNLNSSTLWEESLHSPKTNHNLTTNIKLLNFLTAVPTIFEKVSIKSSNLQTVITMETYMEKENRKALNENSVFPNKKFKTSHFVLRAQNKHTTEKFRNSICFISHSKYVPKYAGTCSRGKKDKKKVDNCGDCQENPCFINKKAHVPPFDTFKKICLNIYSNEMDQISSIGNVIFNDENNEKYSKECTATDERVTSSGSDTLIYSCILPKLFTNCNSLLEQESKDKRSQNIRDINANTQWPKHEINEMLFPMNDLKCFSDVDQYFISAMPRDLCINQNITNSVKAQHSKIAPPGKRRKQSSFEFEKNMSVSQYRPVCSFEVSNRLKHPKIKKVENMNFLLQKDILLSGTHNSAPVPVKQNAEDANKTANAIEQSYTSKRNRHQNLILLYEHGKCLGTKDKLIMASCTRKQKHFEDATESNFSSEMNKKYEFEMKNQFDLVLEELHMFNDISQENENSVSCGEKHIPETDLFVLNCSDSILDDDSKNVCENKANMTFSTSGTSVNYSTMVKKNKNEQSVFKDIVLERLGEQEVPHEYCSSSISDEELFYSSSEEQCDSRTRPFLWKPAFVSHTFMKKESYSLQTERGNSLLGGIIRIQPLKTCCGPLRVGLSRKAKPKQLHPYLK